MIIMHIIHVLQQRCFVTIQEQGESINSIEENVETTHNNVKQGGLNLNKVWDISFIVTINSIFYPTYLLKKTERL